MSSFLSLASKYTDYSKDTRSIYCHVTFWVFCFEFWKKEGDSHHKQDKTNSNPIYQLTFSIFWCINLKNEEMKMHNLWSAKLTGVVIDQIAFSRWPNSAAATAKQMMEDPKYWWNGSRKLRISGENFGKRNAENPRAHWENNQNYLHYGHLLYNVVYSTCTPNRRAAMSPIQLCSVYMLGLAGFAKLWLSKAAWSPITIRMKAIIMMMAWPIFRRSLWLSFLGGTMRYIRAPETRVKIS